MVQLLSQAYCEVARNQLTRLRSCKHPDSPSIISGSKEMKLVRLLLYFALSISLHSQAHDISMRSSSDLLWSISSASSGAIISASTQDNSHDTPAKFLDDVRIRVFAASDLSQDEIDTTLQHTNDAYELWMGPPYYGKSQAKAIYLMITGNDLDAGAVANSEYCDHLTSTGFPSAEWCNPDTYVGYVNDGGAGINSAGPLDGFYFMVMAAGKDPVGSVGYKQMTYHEVFHIYQMTNVFTDSDVEFESAMGRMSGDNPTELVAWWMEGQADFFSALYSRDAQGFKDEMRWALEGTGPFSMSRKEKFFEEGVKLRNISWDQGDLVDLGYRLGSWFIAYLTSRHSEAAIYNYWDTVDELGFEAAFEGQFGLDYRTYLDDFEVWLQQPNEDLYPILDGLHENKIKSIGAADASSKTFRITLEEPVGGEIHTGVGNLRGWAVGDSGIDKIEMWIDGVYAFDVPYGGVRGDVGGAFPDVADSNESGFSMAYSYSSLSSGVHSAKAIAYDNLGNTKESVTTEFSVVKLAEDFIGDPNAVNLDGASCGLESDEITLIDASVSGEPVDLLLKWRTAEQGFEIIEIRGGGSEVAVLRSRQALPFSPNSAAAETSDSVFRVVLEEPVRDEIHSGVGNLRGWAIASDGIKKIEIFIDGGYAFDAPYGGARQDVAGEFPDVAGSSESGFSLAFNYNDLSEGSHVIEAVAHTEQGATERSSSTFNIVKFSQDFISGSQSVDLNGADCVTGGTEITISNAVVAGDTYDVVLDWRVAEQGFEIVEIR